MNKAGMLGIAVVLIIIIASATYRFLSKENSVSVMIIHPLNYIW